ncbi:hypothetical protein EHP00_187 [Ecytonucleospora hepatopenaei]|uniref:Uncharacterized protein n=1 Tax=Ecytonucleospora hepatopenaei TaxID=646526 RepID=A0A1W0E6M5_9MICR|nr:hypothetical protein EHP00_187 [Ecytonucleospora hepatopenaei]
MREEHGDILKIFFDEIKAGKERNEAIATVKSYLLKQKLNLNDCEISKDDANDFKRILKLHSIEKVLKSINNKNK